MIEEFPRCPLTTTFVLSTSLTDTPGDCKRGTDGVGTADGGTISGDGWGCGAAAGFIPYRCFAAGGPEFPFQTAGKQR